MNTSRVDLLNTFLIFLSFGLAYFLPFQLFLLAYAILGPLHYFTEINWIRDKKYFVANKNWVYIIAGCAVLLSIPAILKLPLFDFLKENKIADQIRFTVPTYLNSLFLITIIIAIAFIGFKNKKQQWIIVGSGVVSAILMHRFTLYHVIFGIFLPTIIHVYLFTLLFMWYGNLKKNSRIGYLNVGLMLLVPVIIVFISVDQGFYDFSNQVKSNYVENNFHVLNANISKILGLTDGTKFFFYEIIDLKIQMFIAFAYTYHYLNWFSKTTIIGWHKKMSSKKTVLIVVLWGASVGLYFYDYKVGLTLLLFCSLLHVFLEFPLNVISIKAIGKSIFKS
ncbi:hypothetical protein [uncultured Aquimarina sp.]|uniref:hypothetical protein n=1 Tax=uncultured Aquimarina sp. TaxID=575652 RepID=UPI00260E09E9|nr:hypothetical protein [uncultured Aquimarina sp.]